MDEEAQVAVLTVLSLVVVVTATLFIFASEIVSVTVLALILTLAGLWIVGQQRAITEARFEIDKHDAEVRQVRQTVDNLSVDHGSSTSVTALRNKLRDDESNVLEQIAADAEAALVLVTIAELLASQYPGSKFRIINDELFGGEEVDRTWTILPRTDTDLGWVLQANLGPESPEPEASVLDLAQDLARLALDKDRSRTNLRYQADHDALTGLLSRRAVLAALDSAIAAGRSIGLVYCDIDKFKEINDTLGHQAGDDLLCGISDRLVDAAGEAPFDCQVGRLGGDEYLIVASGAKRFDMVSFVEQLSFAIRVPFTFGGSTISTSLSLGAAFTEARESGSTRPNSSELLKESDLALYQVKRTGRDNFRFFDDELRGLLEEQRKLQDDLASSITSRSGIHAMFQPQFDADRKLVGFEALGRWYRQGLGLVKPDDFLAVAAEHGLMADFDIEVFNHIAHVMGTLRREGREFGSVAINVSAERLEKLDFVQSTLEILRRHSIDPRTIVLEITESSLLHDLHERGKRLEELRTWGVRIAIDDFGTGYSSLSYLRELPVDIVKLDKDFVSDIDTSAESRAIVRAILALANALDLVVIAEGVEREEQHAVLTDLGCDVFQGFLLGHPLEIESARELAQLRWAPDPFSSVYEWSDGPPADASSIEREDAIAAARDL
jgi:diguanylate cyclase (GGDEF)-like protein